MTQEHRAGRRVDLEVQVDFESEHNFYTGFTENISTGGLFVVTRVVRPVGSTLSVRFTVPGVPSPIEADAIVRWVREVGDSDHHGMGLQFQHLSPPVREAIDLFISQRDSIFYDHD